MCLPLSLHASVWSERMPCDSSTPPSPLSLTRPRFVSPRQALSSFTELNVLYLHANKISSFKELKCLSGLTKLRSITLHGNPIAEKKSYRLYLIINLPALNQIDFSPITRQDRETAKTWAAANRRKRAEV